MLLPRKVEEVVISVPHRVYDRVVKALAESGLFHVEKPPRELGNGVDRSLVQAYNAATEKVSKLESLFRAVDLEPRLVRDVEVRVNKWVNAVGDVSREYSDVDREFEAGVSEIGDLEAKLQELQAIRAILESIKHVDADIRRASTQLKHAAFAVGFAPVEAARQAERIASKHGVVLAVDEVSEREVLIALAGVPAKVHSAVAELRRLGWSPLRLPEGIPGNPAKAYSEVSESIKRIIERIETIKENLRDIADRLAEYYTKVYVLREALRIIANTARTKTMAVIRGYVDVRDRRRLERILKDATGGAYLALSLSVRRAEKRIPSKVDIPRFLRPFQRVLELYGNPDPNEIVPTVFMAVTIPVIFGLMFPDAGHGLLVLAFAYFYMMKRSRDWGILGAILGVAGIVGGILAAEFFGPLGGKPLIEMWKALGFETPPLSSPLHATAEGEEELVSILVYRSIGISLWVGAFMLFFGTLLGVVDAFLKREIEDAVGVKIPKFIFFASATTPFLLSLDPHVAGGVLNEVIFGPRETLVSKLVFYGAITGLVWLLLGEPLIGLARGHGAHFGTAFMEAFETILMVMGNIPSFLRIMGLSLAHSGLMMGFTIMSESLLEGGPSLFVAGLAVYAFGNLLTATLEGIIAFAHNLRLHFYEWFSKFYSGTGIPFVPVRVPEGVRIVLAA